jgi:hypothetical protein
MLDSWNDGPAKSAIVDFVGRVAAADGPHFVAPEARVAVFDNDGTLWAEKPAYIGHAACLAAFGAVPAARG